MDNFRVALDGFYYSLFFVDKACGYLVGLEPMNHHVDILDLALEALAILTDYFEV